MTDILKSGEIDAAALSNVVGPTAGFHIAKCGRGGFIVVIGGKIEGGCTTLQEAMELVASVAVETLGVDPMVEFSPDKDDDQNGRLPNIIRNSVLTDRLKKIKDAAAAFIIATWHTLRTA